MSSMKKLLVVEDDKNLSFLLSSQLKGKGFIVDLAMNGEEGLSMFNNSSYDLCILDIMMPKMDGLSLAKEIRKVDEMIPFIFLTARNLKSDKSTGYDLGCDDYITKPFDIDEIAFKINAILKRVGGDKNGSTSELVAGSLTFKHLERSVIDQKGKPHVLSHKESILLKLFIDNLNEVIPRKTLLMEAWGNDDFFTSKSLDVYLTKIRKILSLDPKLKLKNIHGYGYMLEDHSNE